MELGFWTKPQATLAEVLAYENEDVVDRFATDFSVSHEDAAEIFNEMKRWLWITARRREKNQEHANFPLFNEAYAIDMMWHTFILFTKDYADFCEKYFGKFIHHQPKPSKEVREWRAKVESDPVGARQERESNLRQVYEYLYDEIGPDILSKWCEDFPARFKHLAQPQA